ncbi:S8 family peptidase [Deinococcus pimensis]|uniref:S8 family peptidase n=1 Tax=Deinococcus pimensis TaxID=309888 RepID=UPI0004B3A359|nr:S8 family peptidase [Deinococcus pimensis]
MRKLHLIVGLGLLLAACGQQSTSTTTPAASSGTGELRNGPSTVEAASGPEFVAGELIVKFQDGATAQSVSQQSGVRLQTLRELSGGATLVSVSGGVSAQSEGALREQTVSALSTLRAAAAGQIEYAQPNYIYRATATPNDTYYTYQWHYRNMNLPSAWDVTTGANSPVVAVIDTGKTAHPDLANKWVGGYDFISSTSISGDGNGRDSDATDVGDRTTSTGTSSFHGTHVAGTIGAVTNNASGVSGVNWSARILPVRVLGKGGGTTADIVDAIRWASGISVTGVPANAYPAKVINMSLGGNLGVGKTCSVDDPAEQSAINDAVARGTTVVVAAGNDNDNASHYSPASCNNTVTVAATETRNYRAPYSNYGSYVDLAAPGGDTSVDRNGDGYVDGVLSTLKYDDGTYGYSFYQGTSMATPHVAGLVSLMYAVKSTITPAQVLTTLKNASTPLSSTACSAGCGAGLVDARKAVDGARALP